MTGQKNNKIGRVSAVLLALGLSVSMVGTAAAQVEIPEGATIDYAWLNLYVTEARNQTVTVHRVTADWQEDTVTWNSFGSSFDPTVVESFIGDATGWKSIDVTDLVLGWLNGTYPNYGVLLEQGVTPATVYASSEHPTTNWWPELEIGYTTTNGSFSVTIKRLDVDPGDVADTYVWEYLPDENRGDDIELYSGWFVFNPALVEKYALLRFDVVGAPIGCGGHTPGFWSNKNGKMLIEDFELLDDINALCLADDDGWLTEELSLSEFRAWLKMRNAENMAYQLSGQMVAMLLNLEVGFVDPTAMVYYDDGMISIGSLLAEAAAALCEDGYTPAPKKFEEPTPEDVEIRQYQEMLKDALDDANNNRNWVYYCGSL